jgi:DNA-directed RNA polymerase specialized sigma24 family protein
MLVYQLTYERVEDQMRHKFRILTNQHSAASVVHQAWLRLLDAKPQPLHDLAGLCARVLYMVRYAFLDIVQAHRQWDAIHHGLGRPVAQPGDGVELSAGDVADRSSFDPLRLAIVKEFHERVEALPEQQRAVFGRMFYLNMSRRAVATQLGETQHQVRALWLDALRLLGAHIQNLS